MFRDVPAPGFEMTRGYMPLTAGEHVHVQFRSGWVDPHAYRRNQLQWHHAGHQWDIVAAMFT